jgi:hypothetical protein
MRIMFMVAMLSTVALAGCASPPLDEILDPLDAQISMRAPEAVVAIIDTGINPYHIDFRDDTELGLTHPSQYLPDFPADVAALPLNLDGNFSTAIEAFENDIAVWEAVEPGVLYWIPGTKIVGAITFDGDDIFDTGHGTMTASRSAGNGYSLCPECRIAAIQGFTAQSVTFASQQAWIDSQSNSWSPLVVFQQADVVPVIGQEGLADAFEAAARNHLVFGSAGNGAMGKGGVVGHPSFTRSTSGPAGVISVGGHDNGELILWSGSWPHVVADACDNWAAVGGSIDEYSGSAGGGTSSASPYAAGAAARIALEARRILADDGMVGVSEGVLARGVPGNSSMLADGQFTLDEAKELLMKTATARPVNTEHDGESCGMTGAPYNTYPVSWSQIPAGIPSYYLIGYGQISTGSMDRALAVLAGDVELPSRPVEDQWHQYAETLRDTYNDLPA